MPDLFWRRGRSGRLWSLDLAVSVLRVDAVRSRRVYSAMARDGEEQEGVHGVHAVWVPLSIASNPDSRTSVIQADSIRHLGDHIPDTGAARRIDPSLDAPLQGLPPNHHRTLRRQPRVRPIPRSLNLPNPSQL